jgi:signal transduction histidine kinase
VLSILLEKIDLVLPYAASTVRLFNKRSGLLEPIACRNIQEAEWKHLLSPTGTRAWRVFGTKSPLTVRNVQTDPETRTPEFFRKQRLVSLLSVPLIAKDESLGVISFYTREEHEFSPEEVQLVNTIAGRAAIAIQNSQFYEQIEAYAEELRKTVGQLERANRVKDEFLSVMSHELRTPLNVVIGYSGMLKDGLLGELTPRQQEALAKIINRTNDQLLLVNNILFATVLETEGLKVDAHKVNVADVLNQLRSAYEAAIDKDVTLNWDYPDQLPVIETDSGKLGQILRNLIENAIKFTEKGSVTISARVVAASPLPRVSASVGEDSGTRGEGDTERSLELRVADTGVGIPHEAIPFIFDKFRQVDSSETRRYGGAGLGLYIVKKFTGLLGGTVEVETELGKGSTFTVKLPLVN